MSKKSITIAFDRLQSCENIEEKEFITIVKNGRFKKYKVINTKEKLIDYSLNLMSYLEYELGILVTCQCDNIFGSFHNAIFLNKFTIDYCSNPQVDDFLYLNFQQCHFFEDIKLLGGEYEEIIINNSSFTKDLFMGFLGSRNLFCTNNSFKRDVIIKNSSINELHANKSTFYEDLFLQEINIDNDFSLDKIKINKECDFIDCRFNGISKFNKLELENRGQLNFSHCSFYKAVEINFDKISGKLSVYKTNFADRCYLDYEQLENKNYESLIVKNDFKKTKWNFFNVADIYKSNGKTEQYLETFYYFKKYERLEKKSNNKWKIYLLDYIVEITTKYYTSWKRTLLSIAGMIIIFFIVYCSFPDLFMYKDNQIDSKNLFVVVFDMIKNSNIDMGNLVSKFGNILYFTIITFTTVGYGDITPLNWMKAVAGLEALLGIFFTSSFVVALSRKFLG